MLKVQPQLPAMNHAMKALVKGGESAATKNANPLSNNTYSRNMVPSRADSLTDSLEEIGTMFSEKMERKHKALNRRQVQIGLARNKRAVEKVEHLNQLFELLGDDEGRDREQQLAQLREALRRISTDDSDALLEGTGGDPTRCNLMLRIVRQQAIESGDNKLADLASEHQDALNAKHRRSILAGSNTAVSFDELCNSPQQKQFLRNLYYESIVHKQSAVALLDLLLDKVEMEQFVPLLRILQEALADDIAALAPSISAGVLHHISTGLNHAMLLNHTLVGINKLFDRMKQKKLLVEMSALALTRRLLLFCDTGAQSSDFEQLGEDVAGEHPQEQLHFLCRLFPLLNQFPSSLWKEKDSHKTTMPALRKVIDGLFDREQKAMARRRTA